MALTVVSGCALPLKAVELSRVKDEKTLDFFFREVEVMRVSYQRTSTLQQQYNCCWIASRIPFSLLSSNLNLVKEGVEAVIFLFYSYCCIIVKEELRLIALLP